MIALAVPGFILKRKNMLPDKAVAALVAVLIYVSQPFMTIDSFLEKDYQPQLLGGMGISFVLSLAFHVLVYFMAKAVFALFPDKPRIKVTPDETVLSDGGESLHNRV